MRRREPAPVDFSEAPPQELLRFRPSQASPIGPHGRPEPWRVEWTAAEFAAWLRTRAAWRDTHRALLPGLLSQERYAMDVIGVPKALAEAEKAAPTAPPEWVLRRAQRREQPNV